MKEPIVKRRCNRCGLTKLIVEFRMVSNRQGAKGGRASVCRTCSARSSMYCRVCYDQSWRRTRDRPCVGCGGPYAPESEERKAVS